MELFSTEIKNKSILEIILFSKCSTAYLAECTFRLVRNLNDNNWGTHSRTTFYMARFLLRSANEKRSKIDVFHKSMTWTGIWVGNLAILKKLEVYWYVYKKPLGFPNIKCCKMWCPKNQGLTLIFKDSILSNSKLQ